jgi:hypothetical protein
MQLMKRNTCRVVPGAEVVGSKPKQLRLNL